MKAKKSTMILAVILASFLLFGFASVPSVNLSSDDGERVELSYLRATADDNTLVITADYEAYGRDFEVAKDIVVATDSNFTNKLQKISSRVENGKYIYSYELSDPASVVYVEPPILYVPATVSPITIAIQKNEQATFRNSSAVTTAAEKTSVQWFSISNVTITPIEEQTYCVRIMIDPNTTALPRFPKLCIGNKELGGITSMNFNENNEFDFGEFIFMVRAESMSDAETILNEAHLTVKDAMVRVDTTDTAVASAVKALPIGKE